MRDTHLILGPADDGVEAHNGHYVKHMKPPIYSSVQPDETPTQYMHRARQFRRAAMQMADYVNGEQFWPKYALLAHAIELALKAFVNHSTSSGTPSGKEPKQHDLLGWYQLAVDYGLPPTLASKRTSTTSTSCIESTTCATLSAARSLSPTCL